MSMKADVRDEHGNRIQAEWVDPEELPNQTLFLRNASDDVSEMVDNIAKSVAGSLKLDSDD